MSSQSQNLIANLFEIKKEQSRRIHDRYVNAMDRRTSSLRKSGKIIRTILSDLPEDTDRMTHNID